jgi:hypothetical protein
LQRDVYVCAEGLCPQRAHDVGDTMLGRLIHFFHALSSSGVIVGLEVVMLSSFSKRHRLPVPYSGTLPTDPLAPTYPKPSPGHSHGTSPMSAVPMAFRVPSDARATELGVSLTVLECELPKFFSSFGHPVLPQPTPHVLAFNHMTPEATFTGISQPC